MHSISAMSVYYLPTMSNETLGTNSLFSFLILCLNGYSFFYLVKK